jgi:hypothetical protein
MDSLEQFQGAEMKKRGEFWDKDKFLVRFEIRGRRPAATV